MIGEVIGRMIIEIIVEFIWDIILNFIGGSVRWIYGTIWRTIARQPKYKFHEYINGIKKSNDWFDETGHFFVNNIVGILTIIAIIICLICFFN